MTAPERCDYTAFGLRIRSALPILGAIRCDRGDVTDLTIECGSEWRAETGERAPYTLYGDGFAFAMPGVACYRYFAAGRIVVDSAPGADPAMVGGMLIATMLPATIWARGGFVMHAAAAIPPGAGHAIAVMGPSGAGKSTLLAKMIAEGWSVVAEDSIALMQQQDTMIAAGLPGVRLAYAPDDRMWPAAVAVPARQQAVRAPLSAVVVIAAGLEGGDAILAPLPAQAAIDTVLRNRHRPRIATLLGIEHQSLATVAALCRGVTIRRLTSGDPARIALQPLAALARSRPTTRGEFE